MEFYIITEDVAAFPGEYLFHVPTKQIVLCGSFNRRRDRVKALGRGKMITDSIKNFRKIKLSDEEANNVKCKGCIGK